MKGLAASVMTALLAVAIAMAAPAAADVTDVSGSGAFGESVNIKVLELAPVTSGPTPTVDLPSSGGTEDNSLASVKVPGDGSVLTTKLLTVHTEGTTGSHTASSKSSASVADATVLEALADQGGLPDAPLLTASLIASTCESNGDGSSGSTSLLSAKIFGQDPAINPPPNTTIDVIPGALTVILNEQIVTNTPGVETKITVNAVHVIANVPGLVTGDIILSQSRCRAAGPDVLGGAPGGPGGAGGPGAAGPAGPVSATPTFTG